MKVRQDPPAPPGYNGKQGGERFRTILKYPTATDMAMKRYRANDTTATDGYFLGDERYILSDGNGY